MDILVSVGCAKPNNGVGWNIIFSGCGHVIPRSQVCYINGFQNANCAGAELRKDISELECEPSRVNKLLKSFRDKGYDHCMLYHHVTVGQPGEAEMIGDAPLIHENDLGPKELMVNETYGAIDWDNCNALPSTPLTSLKVVMNLPNREVDDMHSFAEAHQNHCW